MKKFIFALLLGLCSIATQAYQPPGGLINTYTLQGCGCGEDDTAELQAAFANPATTVIVPIGLWTISQPIVLTASNSTGNTLVGVDKYASIIRAAAGSNMATMFTYNGNGTIAPFTIEHLTLDANYPNQTSGNSSRIFNFAGNLTFGDLSITENFFENCGSLACLAFNSTGGANRVKIVNNVFNNAYCYQIDMIKVADVLIQQNIFNNYNTKAIASDCPAVRWTNTYQNTTQVVSNNIFTPLVSTENAIEGNSASGSPLAGLTISNNSCNANAVGGCGINVACAYCSITGNTITNGSPALVPDSDNSETAAGIQLTPFYANVVGNSIQNGMIMVLPNTSLCAYCTTGVNIIGNTISNVSATASSGPEVIDIVGITNFVIANNNIYTNYTGTTASTRGIFLGYRVSTGASVIGQGLVQGNYFYSAGSVGDTCMRLLTTSSNQITIQDNVCQGTNLTALVLPSTAVDTNLTVTRNDFSTAGAGISGAPTGTGVIIGNNKLASATQWVQPGGTPTISSGFGSTPSIAAGVNPAAFTINVGTGGSATSGVIGLPTALNGWACTCADITTQSATVDVCRQTAKSTTTATIGNFNSSGAAAAWVASDILTASCSAY